jgi:phage terminase small subunit
MRPAIDVRSIRLTPGAELTDPERDLFSDLVHSCDPKHFKPSDGPLLAEYCRQVLLGRRAADEMRKNGGAVGPDGRLSPWFAVSQRATKLMCILSTRLRLTPASRLHARSAAREPGRPVSYYDQMRDDDPAG